MKIKGKISNFYQYSFPTQAVLVTCNNEKGKTNIITIAWHSTISKDPPLYGISVAPSRYSHDLIEKTKEFVINFAPISLVDKVHFCGTHSGRKTDKTKETNLTLIPGEKLKVPIIKECFAHFECKLYQKQIIGDHTLFIGEVLNILVDKDAFKEDILQNKNIKPTYYIGGNKYTTVDDMIKNF